MYGITSWSSIQECEVTDALTISAVKNKDDTFRAWIVNHDGVTLELPRCKIAIKASTKDRDPEERLFTITIPDTDKSAIL